LSPVRQDHLPTLHVKAPGRALLLEQVVDLDKAVAGDANESNSPPAMGDDGGQLMAKGPDFQLAIPLPSPGMVRLGEDEVAAGDEFGLR